MMKTPKIGRLHAYNTLVGEFQGKLDGIWLFRHVTAKSLEQLRERRLFWDRLLASPGLENRIRRQEWRLAGYGIGNFKILLKELEILAISKAVEDLLHYAKTIYGFTFDIWKNDDLRLAFHSEARFVRALGNVVKHHQSKIPNNTHPNTKILTAYGLKPETDITDLDFDVLRYVFYAAEFLDDLSRHLTGMKRRSGESNEAQGFRRFRRMMTKTMPVCSGRQTEEEWS